MKTDRYKDWEYKFFEGEELTDEEQLFLKNESDNPYFSFLKEEKDDKMDLKFEDFLKKTQEPQIVNFVPKRNFINQYCLAASVVMICGLSILWFLNPKQTEISKNIVENTVTKKIASKTNESNGSIIKETKKNEVTDVEKFNESKAVLASHDLKNINNMEINDKTKTKIEDTNFYEKTSDYNPNYVIVNGKPIYNESEAIAITEDAFKYFASNVTQTINEAENASDLDLSPTINF